MRLIHAALIAAASLSGCAAIDRQEAADSEQLLEAAGFQQVPAGTPKLVADLKDIQPRQVFARKELDGSTRYVFADPDKCDCFFVGGEGEYAKLQKLRQQRLADHAWYMRNFSPISNSPSPEAWGPWDPAGLEAK